MFKDFHSVFEAISKILLTKNWDFPHTSNDLQSIYDQFCGVLTKTINDHIPNISRCQKKSKSLPNYIKVLLKKKHSLYKQSKSDSSLKKAYKDASINYDQAVNSWHDTFESNLCKDPSSKKLNGYIKKKLKSRHTIPPIEKDDHSLIFTDLNKANAFNTAFQNFFTIDNNSPLSSLSSTPCVTRMPRFQIQPADILNACLGMKRKDNRTPEGIPTIFLINTISSLLRPLSIIFNLSLVSSNIPSQWKLAFIIPIFKKGDKTDFR